MADQYYKEIIDPGDKASKLAHRICIESYNNCPAVNVLPHQPGNFRGNVDFNWRRQILMAMMDNNVRQTIQNDGAGGKPQFFSLVGTEEAFYDLGWEIIVMCIDDIVRFGGLPAVMVNDLNVKRITEQNYPLVEALFKGYGMALAKSGLVNLTGEIAVMKHSITAFCDFDPEKQLIVTWGGACIGLNHEDKLIDGSKIKAGMPIVGFWEPGYRCNGGTAFTEMILAKCNGYLRNISQYPELLKFIRKLTIPSKSYAKLITRVHGWCPDGSTVEPLVRIAGIAHITGGGVWGKLGDLLPEGIGADLYNMPTPAEVLLEAQDMSFEIEGRMIDDMAAYGTFHGGCGMMVVCETGSDADVLIAEAEKLDVYASVVGETALSGISEILIDSKFRQGECLSSRNLKK